MNERKYKILRKVSETERKQLSLEARILLEILEKCDGKIAEKDLEALFSAEIQRLKWS